MNANSRNAIRRRLEKLSDEQVELLYQIVNDEHGKSIDIPSFIDAGVKQALKEYKDKVSQLCASLSVSSS